MLTYILLFSLLITFTAITVFKIRLVTALSLLACFYLTISFSTAKILLDEAFVEFANIAIIMTCVAIPAHMIRESEGFEKFAALFGVGAGLLFSNKKYGKYIPRYFVATLFILFIEYILAAFLHNITAILIVVPISYYFCKSYDIPVKYIFCGQLIASNLGGFSSSWGDTPNIIESSVWNLQSLDFLKEIVTPNLIILLVLIFVVSYLTKKSESKESSKKHKEFMSTFEKNRYTAYFNSIKVKWDLFWKGICILTVFLVSQFIWKEYMLVFAAGTIFLSLIIRTRTEKKRSNWQYLSLTTLGMETYLGYIAVFIIASGLRNSEISSWIKEIITKTNGSIFSIAATSYLGTLLTEAASWASASANTIHQISSLKSGAWALGGGICAGSSSILTAASAGILLNTISRELGEELTFKDYLFFGLLFSFFMLLFYTGWFSLIY
jgi:Na+/H+ antiporter NhaD/arsenite permease-like protein